MRVRSFHGFSELDVQGTVVQMDQITWELKSAWDRANSFHLMLTQDAADAANNRLLAIRGIISELDVGGAAREHVFFPLPGQTQDEAWATYRDAAEQARSSLASLGQFISQWTLTAALPRIGAAVGNELKTDLTWVAVGLGVLLFMNITGSARRAFSGYRRRRRR